MDSTVAKMPLWMERERSLASSEMDYKCSMLSHLCHAHIDCSGYRYLDHCCFHSPSVSALLDDSSHTYQGVVTLHGPTHEANVFSYHSIDDYRCIVLARRIRINESNSEGPGGRACRLSKDSSNDGPSSILSLPLKSSPSSQRPAAWAIRSRAHGLVVHYKHCGSHLVHLISYDNLAETLQIVGYPESSRSSDSDSSKASSVTINMSFSF